MSDNKKDINELLEERKQIFDIIKAFRIKALYESEKVLKEINKNEEEKTDNS